MLCQTINPRAAGCLAFLLALPCWLPAQIPWVLPWNDATPGVTDFSALNPPIGTNRVAVDADGHFSVNGRRIKFLGVNFAGDPQFTPTNNADTVAARLAKFGVNSVRFHLMDANWAYNEGVIAYDWHTNYTTTNLNSAQLQLVHCMVSRLKAHGIYSDINLLVGRQYISGDGLGPEVMGMDWKLTHILGYFYPPALALQKEYATKLLTPTNPFTGFPLAQDPAVALVEVINENGMISQWLNGALDTLPARYATNLQARWNAWLAARYTNDTAMLAAWQPINQPLGPNLLANGNFSNGLTGWQPELHGNAGATFARTFDFTNNQPSGKITVTNADVYGWYVQLSYPNLTLISNQIYTISFWAKSSPATNATAYAAQNHAPYFGLGYDQMLTLTTNWQQFTNQFQASIGDNGARVGFSSMGNELATFWYADVRLQAGGQVGALPPGASLANGTVPNVALTPAFGFTGTSAARRDWLNFLRDLENSYYDAMAGHLRTNIGYTGLLIGTVMNESPATVQSRLDVIDAHAYWQHPTFPGVGWDPANWILPNVSMATTLYLPFNNHAASTITDLAGRRIKGKPFTVTEYQNPNPNYYGAEGPLLLAAYAGLQDWDGLWFYDYGQGNNVVPNDCVNDWFDMSRHPTKMANLLLAANLFRRGDVDPATNEISAALTPDHELDVLQNAGWQSIFSSGQLGFPSALAFISRISTVVGANAAGTTNLPSVPSTYVLSSDTGQLKWDASRTNNPVFIFDTPGTKALAGFADNRAVTLGGLTLQPGTTQLGWCSLGLTLTRGTTFTNDCTALIVAGGWWENTGQIWTDASKVSVGTNWGRAPVLAEVVPFTLTLPVGTNLVRVWSLDERGQRKAAMPLAGNSTGTILSVTTNAASIWYELDVAQRTPSRPKFASLALSGTNLIVNGTNGPADAFYYLFASTNVALPLTNWTRLATNLFDANGNFAFTNGLNPNLSKLFYVLQLP